MNKSDKKYLFGMEVATLLSLAGGFILTIVAIGVAYGVISTKLEASEAADQSQWTYIEKIEVRHRDDTAIIRKEAQEREIRQREEMHEAMRDLKDDIEDKLDDRFQDLQDNISETVERSVKSAIGGGK